jgi:hypothetical protein
MRRGGGAHGGYPFVKDFPKLVDAEAARIAKRRYGAKVQDLTDKQTSLVVQQAGRRVQQKSQQAHRSNPSQLLFRTRAAALKYAREHGAKKFSIKKLKRGK